MQDLLERTPFLQWANRKMREQKLNYQSPFFMLALCQDTFQLSGTVLTVLNPSSIDSKAE